MQEEIHDRVRDEDGEMVVRLDYDKEGVTIDPNDSYLD